MNMIKFKLLFCLLCLNSVLAQWDIQEEDSTQTCRLPNNGPSSTCVTIRECPYVVNLLNNSPRPIPTATQRQLQNLQRQCFPPWQGNSPVLCCPPNDWQMNPTTPRPVSTTLASFAAPDVSGHRNLGLINGPDCGIAPLTDRIVGGNRTQLMELPFMALIAYNTQTGLGFRCGAALINNRYVLTAAHCITNLGTLTLAGVRLGEHNIDTDTDCEVQDGAEVCAPAIQDLSISEVIPHPDYNPTRFDNDIGLLRLATAADINQENIKPICLPVGQIANINFLNRLLIVAGWGATETGYSSPFLLKLAVPYVANTECVARYNRSRTQVRIGARQMCAGGQTGRDSCSGDSGGPLMYSQFFNNESRFVQHGIVSFGPRNCGSEGLPGVYTRVAQYMDWILDNIKP